MRVGVLGFVLNRKRVKKFDLYFVLDWFIFKWAFPVTAWGSHALFIIPLQFAKLKTEVVIHLLM